MKKVKSFRNFRALESAGATPHSDNVRIYDEDQWEEFSDHVHGLMSELMTYCRWSLLHDEHFWHMYVKGGRKFAVIDNRGKSMGFGGISPREKSIIGAVLSPDGEVERAFYNDDSECPATIAEMHLEPRLGGGDGGVFEEFMPMAAEHEAVKLFGAHQYDEFVAHTETLMYDLDTTCRWSLLHDERYWHNYVTGDKMFAVIETGDRSKNTAIIGALLSPVGEVGVDLAWDVEMAFYCDDSKCPVKEAERHLKQLGWLHIGSRSNESVLGEYEDGNVCRKCGCDCEACECDECDCGGAADGMDKHIESSRWSEELSPMLIEAIDRGDLRHVNALLETGADLGYRNYYPIKRALKAANKASGDRAALENQMNILRTLISELDYISESALRELDIYMKSVPASISTPVKRLLSEVEVEAADGPSDRVERFPMLERKKASTTYKKSGLKHPDKADLNKDKKISGYEKARGKAIQKSTQDEKEEKGPEKGLTAAQRRLPPGLRKAILAKKKK